MAVLASQQGTTLTVMINGNVRLVVNRGNGFLQGLLAMQKSQFSGNSTAGACGNWTGPGSSIQVTSLEKLLLFNDLWTYGVMSKTMNATSIPSIVTQRFQAAGVELGVLVITAVVNVIGSILGKLKFLEVYAQAAQSPACTTTADQNSAQSACGSQSAASSSTWLATCISDYCTAAPSLRTNLASGSAAFYSATTSQVANTAPVTVSQLAAGSTCAVGTTAALYHTVTEKSMLSSTTSVYCIPSRYLNLVGLVGPTQLSAACSSMQLACPKTLAEQQAVDVMARQGGTTTLWLGGTFNTVTNLWVWPDGSSITQWPDSKALTKTDYTNNGAKLCTTSCTTSPFPWTACGKTTTTMIAFCESMLAMSTR